MYLKILRQKKHLSQEQLAECCKLSLRTVQRAEAGHRVGYSTLRALAAEFDIDVDALERELYAMKNNSDEYMELPLWVRIYLGRGWRTMSRREFQKVERGCVVLAIVMSGISFFIPYKQFPFWGLSVSDMFLISAFVFFASAYWVSIGLRVGDKYGAWPAVESTISRGFFGFRKSAAK